MGMLSLIENIKTVVLLDVASFSCASKYWFNIIICIATSSESCRLGRLSATALIADARRDIASCMTSVSILIQYASVSASSLIHSFSAKASAITDDTLASAAFTVVTRSPLLFRMVAHFLCSQAICSSIACNISGVGSRFWISTLVISTKPSTHQVHFPC